MKVSEYEVTFNKDCPGWTNSRKINIVFLKIRERYANDLLVRCKKLYLNDVYRLLGLKTTKIGNVVGWIYEENNEVGDNFVDFGINLNGFNPNIKLNFNVDGVITHRHPYLEDWA